MLRYSVHKDDLVINCSLTSYLKINQGVNLYQGLKISHLGKDLNAIESTKV